MRKLWRGWVAALGVVVLTSSVSMAQPAAAKKDIAESSAWWSDLFSFGSQKSGPPKPIPEPKKDKGKEAGKAEAPPVTVADKAEQHERARNAFLRRQAVIDRLREIAADTENASLADEANRLEEMARRLYQRESGKILGVAASVTEPDDLDGANAARDSAKAMLSASPGGTLPAKSRGATADSLERSAGLRGGDR